MFTMVPQQQRRRRRRAALVRTTERRLVVARGPGGFGFTIAGQRPCVVSAVATGGPAERAGLRAGDALLTVDGANIARAPHASVARLVAAAPDAISLSVAPRESPPTDTEDTEPDEKARTRRRHPPPRRRPQMMHHPGCHAAPSTSGVNEILQNLSRAQLTPNHAARLECRAVVGYLGTIETPQAAANAAPGNVQTAVRKLRQERRPAAPVLLSVLPNALFLRRPTGQILAQYPRERIIFAGCGSEADRRYFGLVTSAESSEAEASHSCHVFAVDTRLAEHEAHITRAREFQITCTRDPVAERCLEFPPSAEYVVGVIRGMYSLRAEESTSPGLQQISKLAIKGDSPAAGNFSRCNRAAFRMPRDRRLPRREDARIDGQEFVANSPQPSNHSEVTTTSSNSDSGIGFHNDCRNIADRILVVDFARRPPVNPTVREPLRRPVGLVGCGFDADGSFLSNATPVVDGFGGQGRPLNLDDVILNGNDPQPVRRNDDDGYDYNGGRNAMYDRVYSENEGHHYELIPPLHVEVDRTTEAFNSVEIYEQRFQAPSWALEASTADSVSVYSSRSHEEPRPSRQRHMQASLDDMLVLGLRDQSEDKNDDNNFVHPASIKCKVRKSKPLNIISKTKHILSRAARERDRAREREGRRAHSASGPHAEEKPDESMPAAASEPDLRDTQSEQASPFRRWTTGSGSSSYRHHDHRNMYNKQISEGAASTGTSNGGGVARWSLGLEHLLADSAGAAAFAHFLHKEFAAENISFWWSCEQYRLEEDESRRSELAAAIWERHLAERAAEPVNVDAAARTAAALSLSTAPLPPDLFLQAQKQIFNVMKFDSYPRFLRSAVHAECARADLCGLPPPYPAAAPPTTPHPTHKLKKSASNASERRRSGASLLPWKKLQPQVREPSPPVNDVVKSSQSGEWSLCRVVLPDGATSVVNVDPPTSVRDMVERLLQRRNLQCINYDVVLKDVAEGESAMVDVNGSCSALGGRSVSVCVRAAVRVRVGGRVVGVRAAPARPLRHVLRPLLQRHAPARDLPPPPHTHRALHPDTRMQDLDGANLLVVDTGEGGPQAYLILDKDSQRTQDEDSQSVSVASSSSQSEYNGSNGLPLDSVGGASTTRGGATSTEGGASRLECETTNGMNSSRGGGARVRAALRAGPPLHHHPPDYLESIRSPQCARAQCPRAPPPLPPKPRAPRPALA